MDDANLPVVEFDRDHLDRHSVLVVSQVQQGVVGSARWLSPSQEDQAAVVDDVLDLGSGDAVSAGAGGPGQPDVRHEPLCRTQTPFVEADSVTVSD